MENLGVRRPVVGSIARLDVDLQVCARIHHSFVPPRVSGSSRLLYINQRTWAARRLADTRLGNPSIPLVSQRVNAAASLDVSVKVSGTQDVRLILSNAVLDFDLRGGLEGLAKCAADAVRIASEPLCGDRRRITGMIGAESHSRAQKETRCDKKAMLHNI
jgi:hypothetical protein